MAVSLEEAPAMTEPVVIEEQLYCSLTGKPISGDAVYWAPPLVTARELVATIVSGLFRAPGSLGHILFAEQPNVPYAKDAREELAARRSSEQAKLLGVLLLAVALLAAPIILLSLR
jgi:hypothetical protein